MREQALLSRRAAAALPLAALIRPVTAPHLAPCPAEADTDLLELGRQWLEIHHAHVAHWQAWQTLPRQDQDLKNAELDAECEAMSLQEWALERGIHALKATTLAGLVVKARIAAHEFDVDELDIASIERAKEDKDRCDCQAHAALSLALDILKLARTEA